MATKKEGDGEHPSSHYLVVEDTTKPTTWHLRVRDVSGKLDHNLMGAAWAALHGGYRGNKYGGPNKQQAISKLTKLYRSEGMPLPNTKSYIYKDTQGQSWFFGIYSNNFEDREKEFFTWESHLEYAKWLKETGIKIPVTVAHQPKYPAEVHIAMLIGLSNGTFSAKEFSDMYLKLYKPFAFAQTETVIPLNGFMLVIAKILPDKENVVELLNKSNWGMSHGFLTLNRDTDTIKQYRSFELTSLPLDMAANLITVSGIQERKMDEVKGLNDQDRDTLVTLLNADPDQIEEATRAAQSVLQKVLASKELDQEPEQEVAAEYEDIRAKIFTDFGMENLQKAFGTIIETLQTIEQRLDAQETRIKSTERSDDQKIADTFYTPNWDVWNKATDEPENADELREQALGDKPVEGVGDKKITPDDPLQWNVMNLLGLQQ